MPRTSSRLVGILCLMIAVNAPVPAVATVAQSFRVSQPGGPEGENVVAVYILSNSWNGPIELAYTASPNCVSVDGTFKNVNDANRYGLKVTLLPGPGLPPISVDDDFDPLGVRGDTTWVVLDASKADTTWCNFSNRLGALNGVVEKTIDCLFLNARRDWPRTRHLHLEILGAPHFKDFEGVHSLELVPDDDDSEWWEARPLLESH